MHESDSLTLRGVYVCKAGLQSLEDIVCYILGDPFRLVEFVSDSRGRTCPFHFDPVPKAMAGIYRQDIRELSSYAAQSSACGVITSLPSLSLTVSNVIRLVGM